MEDLLVLEDLMVEDLEVEDVLDDLEVEDLLLLEDFIVELLEVELFESEIEDELGIIADELAAGVAEDTLATRLELDGTTALELEANTEDTTLEETAGVKEELDITIELCEDGTLELKATDEELTTLDSGTTETELEESELTSDEVEAKLDTDELANTEEDETTAELDGTEELDTFIELETIIGEDTLELSKLELTGDETGTDDITLELELDDTFGVALNTIFSGLSQGIVKSKLIEKMLYCTLQVRPSPVGTV